MQIQLFPRGTPKFLRIICYCSLGFFSLVGLAANAAGLSRAPGTAFLNILFFIFLACLLSAAFVGLWFLLVHLMHRSMYARLSLYYAQQGYCREMVTCADSASLIPTAGDRAFILYLQVMCEMYAEAGQSMLKIAEAELSPREEARYNTARILCWVMTGANAKAHMLYDRMAQRMDTVYESHPDPDGAFHEWSDDALTYYLTAAALCTQNGNAAKAADYDQRMQFQLSKHDPADGQFIPQISALNQLYASQQLDKAYTAEQALRNEIAAANLPQGRRSNYERMTAQARIFAAYAEGGGANSTQRRLPS